MHRHMNLKLKRVSLKKLGINLGDYFDQRIRVGINDPRIEMSIFFHEFTHAIYDYYSDYFQQFPKKIRRQEETIARAIEAFVFKQLP